MRARTVASGLAGQATARRMARVPLRVDTLDWPVMVLAALGRDFEVVGPPELCDRLRAAGGLLVRAAGGGGASAP